jgi:hypothetical protein
MQMIWIELKILLSAGSDTWRDPQFNVLMWDILLLIVHPSVELFEIISSIIWNHIALPNHTHKLTPYRRVATICADAQIESYFDVL